MALSSLRDEVASQSASPDDLCISSARMLRIGKRRRSQAGSRTIRGSWERKAREPGILGRERSLGRKVVAVGPMSIASSLFKLFPAKGVAELEEKNVVGRVHAVGFVFRFHPFRSFVRSGSVRVVCVCFGRRRHRRTWKEASSHLQETGGKSDSLACMARGGDGVRTIHMLLVGGLFGQLRGGVCAC